MQPKQYFPPCRPSVRNRMPPREPSAVIGTAPERVRAAIQPGNGSPRREEPGVWLPWCMAPVWVLLPIVGCLIAGAIRRPAVAEITPPSGTSLSASADTDPAHLLPIVPLAAIEP